MSKLMDDLGQLHIVTGTVVGDGASGWTLTSNDGSATVTDISAGVFDIEFGEAFLSAPIVVATVLHATYDGAETYSANVTSVSTTAVRLVHSRILDTGTGTTDVTSPDPASGDGIMFVAIGLRNN